MGNRMSFYSSTSSYASSSHVTWSSSKSFKKVIRPFLRACHPDAMMGASTEQTADDAPSTTHHGKRQRPLSQQAKETNLKAVQTINGLIDVLDDLITRCTPPIYNNTAKQIIPKKSAASLPELKSQYEIEFILPPSNTDPIVDGKPIKFKHRDKMALTLRSITISFPKELQSNVRQFALTSFSSTKLSGYDVPSSQEEEAYATAMQLKDHGMSEFIRLLSIAGMDVPSDALTDKQQTEGGGVGQEYNMGQQQRKQIDQWNLSDHFLHELGIDPMHDETTSSSNQRTQSGAYFGRTSPLLRNNRSSITQKSAPPTYSHPHLKQQRESFMKSIPWNKFATDYDQAFLDAQADYTTEKLDLYNINTQEGRERREQFVSQICGSVRIWRARVDDVNNENSEDDDEYLDEIPEGLDVVAQLIAIRRLSLLLYDNFDHLKMERMGRMYEQLTIVLTPPRNRGANKTNRKRMLREDGTPVHRGRKLNKWERRKKRLDRLQPVSRGRMRHVAEQYLGKKVDVLDDDKDSDETKEGEEEEDKQQQQQRPSAYLYESGFKFSYGTQSDQGTGSVTAYIPIDFRDGELVRQMYTHLYDYFDNCCGHVGFLKYTADGVISANVGGDDASDGNTGRNDAKREERSKQMGAEE